MTSIDLAVVIVYFLATLGLGLWFSRSQRSSSDYFLGARDLPAWSVLLSIVATETSAVTVISIPGVGARGDLTFLQLPIGYLFGRIGVALWLLPGYFRGEQETAYKRLEQRFGATTRRLLSVVFLVTRFLGDGVRIFAGAIPLSLLTGWSVPASIVTMGIITMIYTYAGGIKAVIWADVIQLVVYVSGGIVALFIAWRLAGGADHALAMARSAGHLKMFDFHFSLTTPYTFWGGLIGGALLSAASHGTDQLIVQRLLATRSLRDARIALVGSGVVVFFQFLLFLMVGIAIWSAGFAPDTMASDRIFSSFVLQHLPTGMSGLVIAGVLAASMSTHSSSISAMSSSLTYDLYASYTKTTDPVRLLRVGKLMSLLWGVALLGAALAFNVISAGSNTPVVVLALSIASVTYGALLGTYLLAGGDARVTGTDVIRGAATTVIVMTVTIFAAKLAAAGITILEPLGKLAWPWYVPMGTAITLMVGWLSSRLHPAAPAA